MTSTAIILILFGSTYVVLFIMLLLDLHSLTNLFRTFLSDAVDRRASAISAEELGLVDNAAPLPAGLLHFDEDSFARADQRRQSLRKEAVKPRGE